VASRKGTKFVQASSKLVMAKGVVVETPLARETRLLKECRQEIRRLKEGAQTMKNGGKVIEGQAIRSTRGQRKI
jgi:hypothetical protein